jgi:AraC-like DNA-binding protein
LDQGWQKLYWWELANTAPQSNKTGKINTMSVILRAIAPPLDQYIQALYYISGPMPYTREKIIPASWLDIKISFGDDCAVYEEDTPASPTMCHESWLMGLWNTPHTVEWPQNTELIGICFKPGGAYPLLQIPLHEVHNQFVSLDLIWSVFAAETRERLYAVPTVEAKFLLLEEVLLKRLCDPPPAYHIVQYALRETARSNGALSIRALSEHIGISQNHLNNLFKQMVGGAPKELARLHRFQHIVNTVDPTQSVDWTQIAHQYLYYDQSHFIKEFAAFTGYRPTDYIRLRRKVHSDHPEHAQQLREIPTD